MIHFCKNPRLSSQQRRGDILLSVLIFAAITVTITIGLVNWGAALLRSVRTVAQREQALQIAEAGIDYYRWHLGHAPLDFQDGTGQPGPYTHPFADKDGTIIGSYILTITPSPLGSTLVTVISKGTLATSTVTRSIKVVMAIPSLAQYATIANKDMRFGAGTVTYGLIQSNGGIHFDGISHGLVASADATYTDQDYGATRWAVYTMAGAGDPIPPTALPSQPAVFQGGGRQLSVPAVDFSSLTANIAQLRTLAQAGGYYFGPSQYGLGYHLVFNSNNNTFDLYVVKTLQSSNNNNCTGNTSNPTPLSQVQWGLWSIQTQVNPQTYPMPALNGVIFFEDDVWVDGKINNSHVTIAAGRIGNVDPNQDANITVNKDLLYTKLDGSDTIGLIAQGNVNVGYDSATTETIDAALVSQNGRSGRYYYSSSCGSSNVRSTLNLFGMIATNQRYGFAYTDNTGYTTRNIVYDANLLYGPPPSFPLTSSFYSTLSWQEI